MSGVESRFLGGVHVHAFMFRGICFWLWVSFLGVRMFLLSCGFRVSGFFRSFRILNSQHRRILELVLKRSPAGCALRRQVSGSRFPGVFIFSFWFRVSEIVVSVLGFGFRVSSFEFSVFWFCVFGFRVSGFGFQVVWWGVRSEVECSTWIGPLSGFLSGCKGRRMLLTVLS